MVSLDVKFVNSSRAQTIFKTIIVKIRLKLIMVLIVTLRGFFIPYHVTSVPKCTWVLQLILFGKDLTTIKVALEDMVMAKEISQGNIYMPILSLKGMKVLDVLVNIIDKLDVNNQLIVRDIGFIS